MMAHSFSGAPRASHWGRGWAHPDGWPRSHRWPYYRGYPFCRHRYWGYYGGWYSYPAWEAAWYGGYSYPRQSYSYSPYPPEYYAQEQGSQQQAEIDRLNDEVERLRAERQPPAAQEPRPETRTRGEPTHLVFRDKHTEQVENYAIVGQTFWVFTEERARKIALADLDIPATKKANEDRGVDFQLPR